MLFMETVAVYCENRTEHAYTLCVQYVETDAAYINHSALIVCKVQLCAWNYKQWASC
jgi:hypothetical protein